MCEAIKSKRASQTLLGFQSAPSVSVEQSLWSEKVCYLNGLHSVAMLCTLCVIFPRGNECHRVFRATADGTQISAHQPPAALGGFK